MQQQEFEIRTKMKVTPEEYKTIEEIYMACGEMDKDTFCQLYVTKEGRFSLLRHVTDEKNITESAYKMAKDDVKELQDQKKKDDMEMATFLVEQSHIYNSVPMLKKAIELVGHREVITIKLERGLKLMEIDKKYIRENLQ